MNTWVATHAYWNIHCEDMVIPTALVELPPGGVGTQWQYRGTFGSSLTTPVSVLQTTSILFVSNWQIREENICIWLKALKLRLLTNAERRVRTVSTVRGRSLCLSVCLSLCLSVCFSVCLPVSLSVCLSVCQMITFESLDVQSSFSLIQYTPRQYRSSSYMKVIRSRSRSQEQKGRKCLFHALINFRSAIFIATRAMVPQTTRRGWSCLRSKGNLV